MDLALKETLEELINKMDATHQIWYTTKEACAYAKVSRKTLYNAVQRGSLKRAKGHRKVLYKREWLDNYVMNGWFFLPKRGYKFSFVVYTLKNFMASKSKTKGNNFERECVNIAKEKGIEKSIRAYASDGRSLGQSSECDIMINEYRLQCKIRKQLPKFLDLDPDKIDGVLIRQDRKKPLILIDYEHFLDLIKDVPE